MKGLMNLNKKDVKYSRRKFLCRMTGAATAGIVAGPLIAAAQYIYPPSSMTKQPDPLEIAGWKDLQIGNSLNFAYNDAPAALIRVSDNEYKAFYLKCTHLGCTTHWSEEDKLFICPCHAGKFDADGNVVAGPPPTPLVELKVFFKDESIWVQEREV